MNRESKEAIWRGALAGTGALVYFYGAKAVQKVPVLLSLLAIVTALMIQNGAVRGLVRECRKQHRFTLRNKEIRENLILILVMLIILWVGLIAFPG